MHEQISPHVLRFEDIKTVLFDLDGVITDTARVHVVALVQRLKTQGIKTAVVSSSKNCAAVLAATRLTDLFDIRLDGIERARLRMLGKPAPDTFLEAAR